MLSCLEQGRLYYRVFPTLDEREVWRRLQVLYTDPQLAKYDQYPLEVYECHRDFVRGYLQERRKTTMATTTKKPVKTASSSKVTSSKKVVTKKVAKKEPKRKVNYVNECTFTGHLGREPEEINTSGGSLVKCSMSLWQPNSEKPVWLELNLWGTDNEEEYHDVFYNLEKGTYVQVTGHLNQRFYTTRDGQERSQLLLIVTSIEEIEKWEEVEEDN